MISFRVSKLTDLVVDVSLTSVARGDVLYRGASKWNNLAAGASGSLLMSGGAGADPSWSASLPASIITSGTIGTALLGSGTANSTTFLRGDSSWQTVTVPTASNPTGTIGTSAVNGSASTFMRSDAAPAISQAITPTWTGQHVFETGAAGTSPTIFRQTGGTPGTHEVQVSHNGTTGLVECKSGYIGIKAGGTSNIVLLTGTDAGGLSFGGNTSTEPLLRKSTTINSGPRLNLYAADISAWATHSAKAYHFGPDGVQWVSSTNLIAALNTAQTAFVSIKSSSICLTGSRTATDTGLGSPVAKVVSVTDGSTGGGTLSSPPTTPAQITSNQDNYAPGVARNYRLSSDASRDITGLSVSQVDGQECYFFNVGAQNIVLKHDVTSTAANRFYCAGSADITLAPNDIARLVYDATSARWRVGKI